MAIVCRKLCGDQSAKLLQHLPAGHDADAASFGAEPLNLTGKGLSHAGRLAFDQGHRRFRRIMRVLHARRFWHGFGADQRGIQPDLSFAQQLFQHFARDRAGTQNDRPLSRAVHDGRLHAEPAGTPVENQGDAPVHIAGCRLCRRRARTARKIRRGRRDRHAGRPDHRPGNVVFGDADADRIQSARDAVGNQPAAVQDQCDRAGAERRHELLGKLRNLRGNRIDHIASGCMKNQRIVRGTPFRRIDAGAGLSVQPVGAQPIDGFRREGDQSAPAQNLTGLLQLCVLLLHIIDFHYLRLHNILPEYGRPAAPASARHCRQATTTRSIPA